MDRDNTPKASDSPCIEGSSDSSVAAPVRPPHKPRYYPYTSDEFGEFGEVEFGIDNLLPTQGQAVIFGAPQSGKSAAALSMVHSLVTGSPWFGREVTARSVLYVAAEGQAGLRQRVQALEKQFDQPLPERARFVFDTLNLLNPEDVQEFIARISMGEDRPAVVVIDTLACSMPGGDENSSRDMGQVIASTKAIQQAIKGLVVIVHHTGKDASRGMRGHSSLLAALDVAIEVKRHENHRTWTLVKARDTEDGATGAFVLERVELEPDSKGRPRYSIVVVETEVPEQEAGARRPAHKNQLLVLEMLEKRLAELCELESDELEPISHEQAIETAVEALTAVGPKHRKLRAKEAVDGLVKGGYLVEVNGQLGLPDSGEMDD
ncbi:AAA family ATPase [Variovorax sp. VNK109]|uniref:AAA family ATPase n=1 Tax=Variovorax sp. VNK109 TaxID=3400919 RepID=UPI003C09DD29